MKRILLLFGLMAGFVFGYGQGSSLSEPNLENFKILAEKRANQFGVYISKIADKSVSLENKEIAIKQACDLFISDTVRIQISYCPASGGSSVYSRTLIKYLRRLSMLNYDKVKIEWVECVMVGDLKKGDDGNYYGIISFIQRFTGVKGEYTYVDETTKHTEVVLKPYMKHNSQGEEEWGWDVYLSNVNIKEPCS